MEKELYLNKKMKNRAVIKHDDLEFDGKNLVIPSYYTDLILDYITSERLSREADIEDFIAFKKFLLEVQEFKNKGN